MQTDSFILSLIVKATLIFLAGAGIATLLRNASASVRRSVWALTLGAAASLPIGMVAAPAWRVALLPPLTGLITSNETLSGNVSAGVSAGSASLAVNDDAATVRSADASTITGSSVGAATQSTKFPEPRRLVAAMWLAGVAAILFRMLAGIAGLRTVARRAIAATGESWERIVRLERDRLLPGRRVRVLISADVSTPLTFGAMSPVILLPEESVNWSNDHRAVVMRHEMAHIASGDTAVCFAAGLACALYWFHPMAWVAAGRLRREQERACDDRVLEMGTPAADYATHLLEVARSARALGMPGFVSVAMARPTQLEGRLLAVLNERGRRGTVTPAARITGYVASAILMFCLAAVRLEARTTAVVTTSSGRVIAGTVAPAPVREQRVEEETAAPAAAAEPLPLADSIVTGLMTVSPGGVLVLDLKTGAGVTISGTDESILRWRAHLGGRDWRNTDVDMSRTEDGALIETRYINQSRNQSSSHRIEIWVPKRFSLRISSAGGGVALRNITGDFTGATGGGEIRIDRAGGRADLSTGGGAVVVTNSNLSGTVSTGGGSVLIQGVTGGLRGSSGTGDVLYGKEGMTYQASGSGGGTTDSNGKRYIRKSGGSVTLTTVENGASISTGGGAIRIGTSNGDLTANTGGGDISVATLRGSGVLSTGAGDVTVNVSGEGSHKVQVTSGNGRVILTLPPDISARLHIETAYTRDHGPTRIDSDWKVAVTETREWDSTEGTPRRYVRTTGTIGSGKGLIKVRTVNGDVVIRRSR